MGKQSLELSGNGSSSQAINSADEPVDGANIDTEFGGISGAAEFEATATRLLAAQEASALRAIEFTLKSSILKTATDSWMTAARNA